MPIIIEYYYRSCVAALHIMEQRDGRSAAGILSGRSFNAQCLEHCVFGAPIENQIEAADELGRNRANIRCRRDREQNLFRALSRHTCRRWASSLALIIEPLMLISPRTARLLRVGLLSATENRQLKCAR